MGDANGKEKGKDGLLLEGDATRKSQPLRHLLRKRRKGRRTGGQKRAGNRKKGGKSTPRL